MLTSFASIFNNLSDKSKTFLFIGLGVAIATSPVVLAVVMFNAGSLSYKNDQTEITFSGKAQQVSNDSEYSSKALFNKIVNLQSEIEELKTVAETNPAQLKKQVAEVENTFNDLVPTANEAFKDAEELNELVESAIEGRGLTAEGRSNDSEF